MSEIDTLTIAQAREAMQRLTTWFNVMTSHLTIAQAREAMQRGKEIEKLMGGTSSAPATTLDISFQNLQIVILDRGFVFVGNVKIHDGWCIISNAQNVRRWGTSKGLGELAEKGPLKDTVLDPAGIVRTPERAVVGLIECSVASWKM